MVKKIICNVRHFSDKCKQDKINAYSAQTAFFIILSAIPFLMVFFSLLRYTAITEGIILNIITRLKIGRASCRERVSFFFFI